jgi:hypothetical protein
MAPPELTTDPTMLGAVALTVLVAPENWSLVRSALPSEPNRTLSMSVRLAGPDPDRRMVS